MRSIRFVKASACGNDFIVADAAGLTGEISDLTQAICDRHAGLGADGVEWIYPSNKGDIRAHLINSDGSYAEISGNGTRCVAAYYAADKNVKEVRVETGAGVKTCTVTKRDGRGFQFRTAMGRPEVGSPFTLDLGTGSARGIPVSMGNPHFVVFVNEFPAKWQSVAADIQRSERFPQGVNVEFVRTVSDCELEARFFERGAGETMSSGTGTSAVAAGGIAIGRVHGRVQVNAPGGPQWVTWEDELLLEGPATLICRGEYFL